MSKEAIKNLLMDFMADYDPNKWSNDDVYEKYAEKIDNVKSMGEIIAVTELTKKVKDLEHRLSNCIEPKEDYYVIVSNGWKNKKYGIARVKQVVENYYIQETDEYLGSYSADREYGEFSTFEEARAKLEELKNG